ncbi:flagellar motor switch protein FliG [Sphingobium boeckii]|nr:flagellar motor switch protein FliG [Sphingobium boeckii]
MKGSEAAAIFLMLLDEAEAADVLGRLGPDEVEQLGGAMFAVADVSEGQVSNVLDLFVQRARARTTIGFSADKQIRGMMEKALGSDRADNVLSRITPIERFSSLEALKWMDTRTIASVIEHEHPQVAALVMAHLESGVAAEVLQMLDDDCQADIVYRIATLRPVTGDALDELERVMLKMVERSNSAGATSRRGGPSEAAKIVNGTRKTSEQRIVRGLVKLDKTLARTIEDEMFIFDNLMELDEKSLGALLRAVENDILVLALKGAEEKLRNKMLGCMSSRAAQSIQDEMADRGPTRLAEVQEAQREMLTVARRLADSGAIMLGGKGEDYV